MRPRTADVIDGAGVGFLAGLASGIIGELMVLAVSQLFPTDVGIVGFALVWGVPLGTAIGAISGWNGWLTDRRHRAAASAIPGLIAGILAALAQWSAV